MGNNGTSGAGDQLPRLLIINGLPGSGKTTLGTKLADALELPFFCKDHFKELMFDHLGWSDRAWSQKLGVTAWELLWMLTEIELRAGRSIAIESSFYRLVADERLNILCARLPFRAIEVHCRADRQLTIDRYIERARSGQRHPGHGETDPEQLYGDLIPRIRDADDRPLTATDGCLIVDTNQPMTIDLDAVVEKIRALLWPE